uniref:SEL1L2 adaptor subunit of ERAD E3 ligase n=1 Tax=Terrapene triunguis TaxID=2587831 RepID=A0A674IA45_9SAUR
MIVPILLLLYILLCYENFHFHVAHMYAHLGYPNAQHIVGQRYLQGTGVEKNEEMAMHWFREAAEQGHPHSSFNLAVGKLKNMTMRVYTSIFVESTHHYTAAPPVIEKLEELV